MGSLRRGLILALLPSAARAEVCNKTRPNWDGSPVSMLQEALYLSATPISLFLIITTLLALRLRHQWVALGVVVGWTIWVSMITMADPTGLRAQEMLEGCAGQPTLFIAAVAAICIGTILYTTPRPKQSD